MSDGTIAFQAGILHGIRARILGKPNPGKPYQTVRTVPQTSAYNLGCNQGYAIIPEPDTQTEKEST